MDEKFHEESFELVLPSNHNNNKETTINMGARKDIHDITSLTLSKCITYILSCLVVNTNQTRVHLVPI
jgi:hypothetical protein